MNNKTKTAIKWIIAATAFMLIAVIVVGLPLGWFDKKEEVTDEGQETVQAGGMVVDDETEGAGIALMSAVIPVAQYEDYGISTASVETAYTVTAVVEPDNTTDTLSWAVQWKNGASTFATGKTVTDYVTVRSTGDRTATVECKQAFGEVVQLKVSAASAPTVSATKDINYLKRPTTIDFYPFANGNRGKGYITVGKSGSDASNLFVNVSEYGVGTVTGEISVSTATIEFSDQYCQGALRTYITKAQALVTSGATISTAKSKTLNNPKGTGGLALSWNDFYTATGAGLTSIGTQAENHLKSGIVYMSGNGAPGYGKVKATVIYTYGSIQLEYPKEADITKVDASALKVGMSSVSFSDSGSLTF